MKDGFSQTKADAYSIRLFVSDGSTCNHMHANPMRFRGDRRHAHIIAVMTENMTMNDCIERDYHERQANGMIIEEYLISSDETDYWRPDSQSYSQPGYDAFNADNVPVQIKAKKTGRGILKEPKKNGGKPRPVQIELGCGNNKRLWKDEDFLLDITAYNASNTTVNRIVFHIDCDKWNAAINPSTDDILSMEHVFGGITNDRSDDGKWRKRRLEIMKEYYDAKPGCVFRPRFKRDHKNQKRIQMAITDIDLENLSTHVDRYDGFKHRIK